MRQTRYVYFICGHVRVHPPVGEGEAYTAPFDHIMRAQYPVTSNADLERLTHNLRHKLQAELTKATGNHLAGDPIIRQVSLLHTILVEAENLEGPAVRVMS